MGKTDILNGIAQAKFEKSFSELGTYLEKAVVLDLALTAQLDKSINTQQVGLYQKYLIKKSNGDSIESCAKYFVLRYDSFAKDQVHVKACRKALAVYAGEIKQHLPLLHEDLIRILKEF